MKAPASVWAGRVLTGLFAVFIAGASVFPKLSGMPIAEATLTDLGWPSGYVLTIGLMELGFLILYLIPRTSVLGAVMFTGLLGGAIATNVRADMPLFSHQLFGLYLGLVMWGGLWLRDASLRAVFPLKKTGVS